MIEGISHLTFIVKNLEKSKHLFEYIFDAKEVYNSGEENHSLSKEKFFLINEIWIALMEGDSLHEKTYNHIAFKVTPSDLPKYIQRIQDMDLEIKEPRTRIDGEAESIYFYDFDNHLFEIHTGTLEKRLEKYKV